MQHANNYMPQDVKCYLPRLNTFLPGAPFPLPRRHCVPFSSRLVVSRSVEGIFTVHPSTTNTQISEQIIPAPHFLLLAPWCLSHPGFPIFWAFIHCHSFELSFSLTVGSELLEYIYKHVHGPWWCCTLKGEMFSLKESDSTPGNSAPAPSLFVLYSCNLIKESFKGLSGLWQYLACLLLPGFPWGPEPAGPPCSRSLSLNCKLLVPLQIIFIKHKLHVDELLSISCFQCNPIYFYWTHTLGLI